MGAKPSSEKFSDSYSTCSIDFSFAKFLARVAINGTQVDQVPEFRTMIERISNQSTNKKKWRTELFLKTLKNINFARRLETACIC